MPKVIRTGLILLMWASAGMIIAGPLIYVGRAKLPTSLTRFSTFGLGGVYGNEALSLGEDLNYAYSLAVIVNVSCVLAILYFLVRQWLAFMIFSPNASPKLLIWIAIFMVVSLSSIVHGLDDRSSYLAMSVKNSPVHNIVSFVLLMIVFQTSASEFACQVLSRVLRP